MSAGEINPLVVSGVGVGGAWPEGLEFLRSDGGEWFFAVWGVFAGECLCPTGSRVERTAQDAAFFAGGRCPGAGKHPFWLRARGAAGGGIGFEHGVKSAVAWPEWERVAGAVESFGGRLAVAVPSDVWVLDADSEEAFGGLVRLFKSGALEFGDVLAVARTVRGWHVWVRCASGGWRSSTAGRVLDASLLEIGARECGLEVKSGGGYLVWPDGVERSWVSVHAFADRVAWRSRVLFGWGGWRVPAAVEWGLVSGEAPPVEDPPEVALAASWEVWSEDERARAGAGVWDRFLARTARLRGLGEGSRNNALNACAWYDGRLAVSVGYSYSDVLSVLVRAGVASGLGIREAQATARSGLRGLEV